MVEEFLSNNKSGQDAGDGSDFIGRNRGDREPVRMTVSGSKRGLTYIIHQLYSLGFAQVHEWSKPQRHPQTGELFCVLTKHLPPQ